MSRLGAGQEMTIVLSSHLMADVERVCDYLILLVASRVRLTGQIGDLLAAYGQTTGRPRGQVSLDDLVVAHMDEASPGSAAKTGAPR